jgi:hypothetical protein
LSSAARCADVLVQPDRAQRRLVGADRLAVHVHPLRCAVAALQADFALRHLAAVQHRVHLAPGAGEVLVAVVQDARRLADDFVLAAVEQVEEGVVDLLELQLDDVGHRHRAASSADSCRLWFPPVPPASPSADQRRLLALRAEIAAPRCTPRPARSPVGQRHLTCSICEALQIISA